MDNLIKDLKNVGYSRRNTRRAIKILKKYYHKELVGDCLLNLAENTSLSTQEKILACADKMGARYNHFGNIYCKRVLSNKELISTAGTDKILDLLNSFLDHPVYDKYGEEILETFIISLNRKESESQIDYFPIVVQNINAYNKKYITRVVGSHLVDCWYDDENIAQICITELGKAKNDDQAFWLYTTFMDLPNIEEVAFNIHDITAAILNCECKDNYQYIFGILKKCPNLPNMEIWLKTLAEKTSVFFGETIYRFLVYDQDSYSDKELNKVLTIFAICDEEVLDICYNALINEELSISSRLDLAFYISQADTKDIANLIYDTYLKHGSCFEKNIQPLISFMLKANCNTQVIQLMLDSIGKLSWSQTKENAEKLAHVVNSDAIDESVLNYIINGLIASDFSHGMWGTEYYETADTLYRICEETETLDSEYKEIRKRRIID